MHSGGRDRHKMTVRIVSQTFQWNRSLLLVDHALLLSVRFFANTQTVGNRRGRNLEGRLRLGVCLFRFATFLRESGRYGGFGRFWLDYALVRSVENQLVTQNAI